MFERFSERTRQVIVLAQDEARALAHDHIGTEHILLGLLRDQEGFAAHVLDSFDINLEEARAQLTVGRGDATPSGAIPFTPRAKEALEAALHEARSLGHDHIGDEHILLGLLRERRQPGLRISLRSAGDRRNLATRILADLGTDASSVRDEVIRRIP